MTKKPKTRDWTKIIMWFIYGLLLAVLWPHTAWAFEKFEPTGLNRFLAWALAGAFELGIAVFTHKLSIRIGSAPNYQAGRWPKPQLKRMSARYFNIEGFALLTTWGVSSLANLAHSVEFGQPMAIFDNWGIPSGVYSVAFGGILPLMSLLFAWVLSNVSQTEHQEDERLTEIRSQLKAVRSQLKDAERRANEAEREASVAIEAANMERADNELKCQLYEQLFSEDAKARILAARDLLPGKPQRTIANVAQSSPGYVSEVIAANGSGKGE
jgi:hypothetical protein